MLYRLIFQPTNSITPINPCRKPTRVFFSPGASSRLRDFHILDPGGVTMEPKPIPVHCTYSDDGKDIAEIILESFRLFLQKELLALAIEPRV